MTAAKNTTLFIALQLAVIVTFHLAIGVKVEFTINSTSTHVQDMTCSFDGSEANSEINGIVKIDILAIMATSEQRLATASGHLPKHVAVGENELLQSSGNIAGNEGILRLKIKADEKVLKYACRVMVLDKDFRPITMEKLRANKDNLLMSMLNQRFAGISSGVDLQEAFQKLEDKVEDTQESLTNKLEETMKLVEDLPEDILSSETNLNDTKETVSKVLDIVRLNEDRGRTIQNKLESYSGVLESLVKEMANVKETVEKVANQTRVDATSCHIFRNQQVPVSRSRVTIKNADGISFLCDTETDGGGWTIFQRRVDGNIDFYRDWANYVHGFGSMNSSFWMGLKHLSSLVAKGRWEMRVDMQYKGTMHYADFSIFDIGDSSTNYALTVGGYSGTAGHSLSYHNGKSFSTYDMDNDEGNYNCAEKYTGAWWYGSGCHESCLNGRWGSKEHAKGVFWRLTTGDLDSATFTEMKVRPVQ